MKTAPPRATGVIAAITVACFVVAMLAPRGFPIDLVAGFLPARVGGLIVPGALPLWLTPLTATLIHSGLLHIGFNLMMLFYCGREDEVALGAGGVVVLYLVGAYAAAAGQYVLAPGSVLPMVGSSGAVSALVGAYVMLYGRRHATRLPAETARWLHILWLATAWIAIQFLFGLASNSQGVAIATGAHVGGFIAGLLMARPLLRWRYRKA